MSIFGAAEFDTYGMNLECVIVHSLTITNISNTNKHPWRKQLYTGRSVYSNDIVRNVCELYSREREIFHKDMLYDRFPDRHNLKEPIHSKSHACAINRLSEQIVIAEH